MTLSDHLMMINLTELTSRRTVQQLYNAWSYKKKRNVKMKNIQETWLERNRCNKCLITGDLKPFALQFEGNHYGGKMSRDKNEERNC